jgi:hypothetical protein
LAVTVTVINNNTPRLTVDIIVFRRQRYDSRGTGTMVAI